MPEPIGLTATGATAAEDTFIIGDIGQDQGQAALMCAAPGPIPAVVTLTTEAAGAGKSEGPHSPLKGEQKQEGCVESSTQPLYFNTPFNLPFRGLGAGALHSFRYFYPQQFHCFTDNLCSGGR